MVAVKLHHYLVSSLVSITVQLCKTQIRTVETVHQSKKQWTPIIKLRIVNEVQGFLELQMTGMLLGDQAAPQLVTDAVPVNHAVSPSLYYLES